MRLNFLGTAQIEIENNDGTYVGEINENGEAHGEGTFTNTNGNIYKGMFRCNKVDGYCKFVRFRSNDVFVS